MKLFSCPVCHFTVYFENDSCEHCGAELGYDPGGNRMLAFAPGVEPLEPLGRTPHGPGFRHCANRREGVCNWLVPLRSHEDYCLSCRHNDIIPNLSQPGARELWRRLERAKRYLVYAVLRLGLPLTTRAERSEGLAFRFLDDNLHDAPVMTGHDAGLITIALAEADDAEREKRRSGMGEPYRTLIGHFRHEVGHWYWDRLIRDGGRLESFRSLFGDDSRDYGEALQRHYGEGPPPDWQARYVSAYAAAHPWEDWAESFAHYLHMIDTLEMAASWNVSLDPRVENPTLLRADIDLDIRDPGLEIGDLVADWLALSAALNALNRSMGQQDAYPFVLTAPVVEKLGYIHDVVTENRVSGGGGPGTRQGAAAR